MLISLLVWLLIFLVVVYVFKIALDALTLPQNIKNVVMLIFGLIMLLVLLSNFGLLAGGPVLFMR